MELNQRIGRAPWFSWVYSTDLVTPLVAISGRNDFSVFSNIAETTRELLLYSLFIYQRTSLEPTNPVQDQSSIDRTPGGVIETWLHLVFINK